MLYDRRKFDESLKHTASSARAIGSWSAYADFCLDYERGLRRQAFVTLHRFISEIEHQPFAERRSFVSWLLTAIDGREGRHMLIPNPLQIRVVEPTLLEWTEMEPNCAEPHRWIGDQEHLGRALELDPGDQIARRKLILMIISYIEYATHELPEGYMGHATDDLFTLQTVRSLIAGLRSDDDLRDLTAFVDEEEAAIQEYLRRR